MIGSYSACRSDYPVRGRNYGKTMLSTAAQVVSSKLDFSHFEQSGGYVEE
ncbi:MAG: hypothetical protein KME35_18475 [Aphanocapsa sp. GSE-SYN-MK-11-07L]|jgi:hypothetical protein|nr:hypothetical protein [Aphanocapsa sp. GSE-SYN-MK-11-07L]